MKVIIAGSRGIKDMRVVKAAMDLAMADGIIPTEVVSGGAPGVDWLGEHWADERLIPIKRFPANWNKFGKAAGMKRNAQMAKYADALVAIWDGTSAGTRAMIRMAKEHGLKTYIHVCV